MIHFARSLLTLLQAWMKKIQKQPSWVKKFSLPNQWFYIRLTVKTELRPEFTFLFSDFAAWLDRGPHADTNIKPKQKGKLLFMLFSCLRAFWLKPYCFQKFAKAMKGKVQSYWFYFLHLLANHEQSFNNLCPSFEAVNKVLKSQG